MDTGSLYTKIHPEKKLRSKENSTRKNMKSKYLFLTAKLFFFIAGFFGVIFCRQTHAREFNQGHSMAEDGDGMQIERAECPTDPNA